MYRTPSPASPDDIDIAALGRAVWSKWRLIAGLALVAGVFTYVALSAMTPLYTSEARLLINNEETVFTRPATTSGNEQLTARPAPDPEAVASQVQVLLSRDLALEVVKDLNLDENSEFTRPGGLMSLPRQMLGAIGVTRAPSESALQERVLDNFSDRLSVYQISDSRVIVVSFTSENPQLSADVANKLAQAYLSWQQEEKLRQTRDATLWLSAQIDELRNQVEESEAKAEAFRSQSGLFAGENNTTLDVQQLSELNSQVILAKAQRTEAEARAKLIDSMLQEGDVDASPDVLRSELIQRLLEQRVQVQRQLAEMSATLLPSHPRIRQLQAELADVRSQIRAEARKIVTSLQNEAQIAGTREASLRESLNELKQDSTSSNASQIRLRALEREAKANRDLLESYLARFRDASARQDEASIPADASIISRAHASSTPSFPKKIPYSILASMAVTLLGFGVILTRELIRGQPAFETRDIQRRVDVAAANFAAASQPPENSAPERPEAASTPSKPSSADLAPIAAATRRVLGKLTHAPQQRVLIAGQGVDATEEAIELARLLAKAAEQLALVDMTQKAGVATSLGLPSVPGMRELASGRATFEQVVRLDPESAVQVFAGGNQRLGPVKEADEGLLRVLKALDQTYDCTLVLADAETVRALAGPDSGQGDEWGLAVIVAEPVQDTVVAPLLLDPNIEVMRCQPSDGVPSGGMGRIPFPRNLPFMRRTEATLPS